MMCDKELLVAYVYNDLADAERVAIDRHLRDCAECRDEVAGLRGLRTTLTAWTPPRPDLAIRVVDRAEDTRPAWRTWWTPAFGLAAAAMLVLAAASALAHVQVQYGPDGFAVRTGWDQTTAAAAVQAAPATVPVDVRKLEAEYAAMERRVRDLESAAQQPSPVRAASVSAPSRQSDTEILRRVHDMLAQSESRQQQELALRIAQVIHDVEAQRTADLTQIQQGLGRIDAMTTAEAAAHRDLANYIMTSSSRNK